MEIKPSEISALIKAQINDYDSKLEDNDVGTVVTLAMVLLLFMVFQML